MLLLSLAMAMVDMVDMAMVMDMAAMDTMATMARGRLRHLLWLLLSQKLLLSLVTDTMAATAMVATEVMAMAVTVTTAIMERGLLMLMPTMAMEDTEVMVMVTAMATTARDLPMPTTATEDTVDMVMATAMATVMDTDTMDKKKEVMMMSRKSSVDTK